MADRVPGNRTWLTTRMAPPSFQMCCSDAGQLGESGFSVKSGVPHSAPPVGFETPPKPEMITPMAMATTIALREPHREDHMWRESSDAMARIPKPIATAGIAINQPSGIKKIHKHSKQIHWLNESARKKSATWVCGYFHFHSMQMTPSTHRSGINHAARAPPTSIMYRYTSTPLNHVAFRQVLRWFTATQ